MWSPTRSLHEKLLKRCFMCVVVFSIKDRLALQWATYLYFWYSQTEGRQIIASDFVLLLSSLVGGTLVLLMFFDGVSAHRRLGLHFLVSIGRDNRLENIKNTNLPPPTIRKQRDPMRRCPDIPYRKSKIKKCSPLRGLAGKSNPRR